MKILLLILALLPAVAQAQSSSGLLATNRAIDWSHAGATIATRNTQCGSTISAGASAATIQAAISSCAGTGQYVLLGPGTFSTAASLILESSNVTLRGSGPTSTILNFTGTSTNCNGIGPVALCIYNGDSGTMNFSANQCSVTGGLSRGATSFTMGTCGTGALGNLKIGALVQLTANDEASDNGQWWACGSTGTTGDCSQQGSQNSWNGNTTTQMVTVTNISGSTITISPGIYAPDWASGRTLNALYSSTLPVTGFGLENLQVNTQSLGDIQAMVETQWVTNSWMKNVSLVNAVANNAAARKHAEIGSSTHFTIRDSYLYGSSPTSEAYGIDFTFGNADSLAENNICQHIATCAILENGMGNVFGYNYAVDNFYIGNPPGSAPNWQQCDATHHAAGDVYNLWEGHEGICAAADDIHGTAFANTIFRSYFNGHDPATLCPGGGTGCGTAPKTLDTGAFNFSSFNRYYNIALSIAGTAGGYFTTYQQQGASGSPSSCPATNWTTIYNLNYGTGTLVPWSPACTGASFIIDNDPLVSTSLMRWGNYDVVNAAVRTNSGETGSSASTYPGLSSPSTSYSSYPSLYLSAKPAFFGSNAWPPVGPDVSGGPLPNGSKHNPAELCYASLGGLTDGSTGSLGGAFDASVCYSSTPTVATPTFSPGPGVYGASQTVTVATITAGATLCYTVDGSTPMANGAGTCTHGTTYSTAVTVASSLTLKAVGSLSGNVDSSVSSAAYVINGPAAAPTFLPVAGSYGPTQSVAVSTATAGSTLCYTTDGSAPTANGGGVCTHGATYTTAVSVASSLTLKAVASQSGFLDSSVGSSAYVINGPVSTPTFSPVAGAYGATQSVTISTVTAGATLCYTVDGTTPTANGAGSCTHGTTYGAPVSVASSLTLKAIGSKGAFSDSAVGSAAYTINGVVGTPTFLPVAGTYTSAQSVAIATSTSGATICYTVDGTTPTANGAGTCTHGTTYSSAVPVSSSLTLKAVGSKTAFTDSSAASAAYVITLPVAAPTFSPVAGTYTTTQSVVISTSTGGATLCYTVDGTTPAANGAGTCTHGTTYSSAVSVSSSLTLKAVGTESGFSDSSVGSAAYVISAGVNVIFTGSEGSNSGSPTRDAYTNCATSCSGGVPQPPNSGSVSHGQLWCNSSQVTSCGSFGTGFVTSTITGTGTHQLDNGLGAGGFDSLANVSISYGNASAGDCPVGTNIAAQLVPTLILPGQVPNARSLFSGTSQSSNVNTSWLAPTKWAIPGGDAANYYVVQMCETVPVTTGTGVHAELDLNHTLSTDDYVGPGSHYDFGLSQWDYCMQGCSGWKKMNLVNSSGVVTPPFPAGHHLYMEWYYHRTLSCTHTSGSQCVFYDSACFQDYTAGTPMVCGQWQDATTGLTPGGVPVLKSGFTTNQINVQHQGDSNCVSCTFSVNSDFRNVVAYSTNVADAPTFSPLSGTPPQTVTIATTTPGATICYTTDGSSPTATTPGTCSHGTTYSGPVSVTVNPTTLTALSTVSGSFNSATANATYSGTVSYTLTVSVAGSGSAGSSVTGCSTGTYASGTPISCTPSPGAGMTFTGWSGSCTGTVVPCNFSLGSNSSVTATFDALVSSPTFSPVAGSYAGTQSVALSSTTSGVTVCYTVDGTTPTGNGAGACTHGTTYGGTVSVATSLTLKTIGTKLGYIDSNLDTAAYTINGTVATPTFSPAAGSYGPSQVVTISTSTAGATLCYTTDGSAPTANGGGVCTHGATYGAPVTIAVSSTLKAVGSRSAFLDSGVGSAAYVINGAAATPAFSPVAGTYTSAQSVTLTSSTSGASIYYTTNGTTPTTSSTLYTLPVNVSVSLTLQALAVAAGYSNSAVGGAAYAINIPTPAAAPTFSPGAGTYGSTQTVALSSTTPSSTVYYTTDGSTPTTSSPVYSTPLTIAATTTIKAVATASGFTQSAVSSALFTINVAPQPPTLTGGVTQQGGTGAHN